MFENWFKKLIFKDFNSIIQKLNFFAVLMSSSSSSAACYENHLSWKMIVSCTRDIILYYLLFFLTVYATYQSV